ncbi:Uncharacterized membrane protein, YraQ family [hydrothermal vent metagenome]|uniref:Uncharacterized membrane protein, YraQ family n=1 Tax=hydrothermal vent metagenome TaxID=652676 RepID=A0A3B0XT30_9ZZZZ
MPPWLTFFTQNLSVILLESAPWIIISLFIGGLVHEFLPDSRLRNLLDRKGPSAMGGAVLLGGLLPICSCGVIPLAVSLYRSGVRLGPVMAFTAATPIINPAAVILSLALLGPRITFAYCLLGITLPIIMGYMAQRWGEPCAAAVSDDNSSSGCCTTTATESQAIRQDSLISRSLKGLNWGFLTLGPNIGFYLAIGIILASLMNTFVPDDWMHTYLGNGSYTGLLVAALLGASIYVCAVAHIPLVAALIASGAAPGAAIVFLVTGTATNLPELFTLYRTIGKRTVIIYTSTLILCSLIAGALVNLWLEPGFDPSFDPLASLSMMDHGDNLWWSPSAAVKWASSAVVLLLACLGVYNYVQKRLNRRNSAPNCCS